MPMCKQRQYTRCCHLPEHMRSPMSLHAQDHPSGMRRSRALSCSMSVFSGFGTSVPTTPSRAARSSMAESQSTRELEATRKELEATRRELEATKRELEVARSDRGSNPPRSAHSVADSRRSMDKCSSTPGPIQQGARQMLGGAATYVTLQSFDGTSRLIERGGSTLGRGPFKVWSEHRIKDGAGSLVYNHHSRTRRNPVAV